ncbi:hypothetical protein [Pectinatus sottacetonis]|uniref:hypothetical protein n=1 Tax=Pectinatus sottacetonis TaxID=1002795 RepID=UPI0018C844E7|nr:hypothetical protein [Pectinatus sottacetonis]
MPIQPQINAANPTQKPTTSEPVDKSNSTQETIDTSSGFRPQTDVSIRSAITDLSKILSEITSTQNNNIEDLPPEIQKLIQDILQNSFSLDKTLSQGLSDTIQAKRYAFDELALLGKFLTQLGDLIENNNFNGLPADIKTLLSNFRSLISEDPQMPNTVDLLKTSFNLLNGKTVKDLPPALKNLLSSTPSDNQELSSPLNKNMQTLKNLLETLFKQNPHTTVTAANSGSDNSAKQNSSSISTGASAASATTHTVLPEKIISPAIHNKQPALENNVKPKTSVLSELSPDTTISKNQAGIETTPTQTNTRSIPLNEKQNIISTEKQTDTTSTAVKGKTSATPELPANNTGKAAVSQQNTSTNITGQSKSPLLSYTINNTPQSLHTLQEMGNLVLKSNTLTPQDTELLKQFVNNTDFPLENIKQLQKALQVVEQNIPGVISEAANEQELPNLPKLWTFVQLSDISTINTTHAETLKQTGKDIEDFSKIMNHSFSSSSTVSSTQKSLDFILPVFLDEHKSYPTYVNVYNEGHKNTANGETQYETWLRVCCLTENAGAVEVILRLYNKQNLNIRLAFSNENTALSFEDYLPDLRAYLHKSKLTLTELKIGAID